MCLCSSAVVTPVKHEHDIIQVTSLLVILEYGKNSGTEKICFVTPTTGPQANSLRLRQNGCHFTDNIFKCIFLNENVWIPIKISLKFASKGPLNDTPALD